MKLNKRRFVRVSFYFLFGLFLLVLQTTIVPSFAIFGITPSLLLVAVVVLGVIEGNAVGALFGAILGFSVDVISSRVIGMEALYFMLCGIFSGTMCEYVFRKNIVSLFFVYGSCILAKVMVYFIIYVVVMYKVNMFYGNFVTVLLETLYSVIFLLPFFIFIKNRHRKLSKIEKY